MPRAPRSVPLAADVPRAILDTNVLVSALITPHGASARLLVELRAGAFELIVSPMLLAELQEVLLRDRFRRYVSPAEVDAYVELVRSLAVVHDDPECSEAPLSADPDDDFLVALAREARVAALVSGDGHLLALRPSVPAMTPAEFLATLAEG